MAKIFIVGRQEWTTNDRMSGEEIQGISYIGYSAKGTPLKFTSREIYPVFEGEIDYNAELAIEVPLLTKFFMGKISFQDGRSFGQKPPVK